MARSLDLYHPPAVSAPRTKPLRKLPAALYSWCVCFWRFPAFQFIEIQIDIERRGNRPDIGQSRRCPNYRKGVDVLAVRVRVSEDHISRNIFSALVLSVFHRDERGCVRGVFRISHYSWRTKNRRIREERWGFLFLNELRFYRGRSRGIPGVL